MPSRSRSRNAPKPLAEAAAIIRLQDYKAARHAAAVLEGLLHEPPWLCNFRGSVAGGQVRLIVRLHYFTNGLRTGPSSASVRQA